MDVEALRSRGLAVIDEPLHVDAYRRDLWPRDTLLMYQNGSLPDAPAVVVSPRTTEEIAQAIAWAEKEGVEVVPYGAGSGVCGGARGRAGSLVIDLKRMNRILSIDVNAHTVHVQSGILGQHLEDQLKRIGWMTAHSPSSIACSTTGGYLAARSAGQFSSRYGVFDDMLLAASAETPTGQLRCGMWTKNGSEDLLPILCGSEGGLGVVTDMLLRIQPTPQQRWLRGYAFPDMASAWNTMRALMQSGLWPSVLRLYDPVDTTIGGKTKAADAKTGPGIFGWMKKIASENPAMRRHLLNIPLAVPGLLNRLGATLGKEVLLIVGFEGSLPVVHAATEAAMPILETGRDLGPEPGEHWYKHRHDVSYKLAPVFLAGAFADTMEVAATWERLPALYDAVQSAIGSHAAVMAHFSHAYPEGCSIYFSFAGRGNLATYDKTWKDALQAAQAAGGTVTHHHGVGILKADAAAAEAGSAIRVWQEIKAFLDPSGIMNPGRPFPEEPTPCSRERELEPPKGGPVFNLDPISLIAKVDPHAAPAAIQEELHAQGFSLQILPDRPLAQWLPLLQRDARFAWENPMLAIQAVFNDGTRTQISPAPRSAAGPDLRWSLMRRAHLEWVDVPIRTLTEETIIEGGHPNIDVGDIRPIWHSDSCWAFSASQLPLAEACFGEPSNQEQPARAPKVER